MAKKHFATRRLTIIGSGLCIACLVGLSTIVGFGGKQTEKKIVDDLYPPDTPVVVAAVKVSGRSIKLGEGFDDDDDWLSHLSLKLKNVSDKTVVFVALDFDFPETKATGNVMAFPLQWGRNPRARVPFGESKRMRPQESSDLALSQDEYQRLERFLVQRHSIGSIHRANIRITTIYFEDGSIWSNGSWVHPDPNNPNRLIPIDN
jgi:hypothetical protein